MEIDHNAVATAAIELFGGRDKARATFESEHAKMQAAWNRDTALIGRILRAHLFVEHFLGEYLSRTNPRLGKLDDARLSFAQKIALVGDDDSIVRALVPGIRHLNVIRNRVAHRLTAAMSNEDSDVFLANSMFRAMRDALCAPSTPSTDPTEVLEDFSRHAGIMLDATSSPDRAIWAEAIQRGVPVKQQRNHGRANQPLQPPSRKPRRPQSKRAKSARS
jgi:hypothetical protein